MFTGNASQINGGAIYNAAVFTRITGCTFDGNRGRKGGAIYVSDNRNTVIDDCSFLNNRSTLEGGALYNLNATPVVTGSTFHANTGGTNGGAIYNAEGSHASYSDCVFTENTSSIGGAMCNDASSPSITRCQFTSNRGAAFGGGVYNNAGSHAVIMNSSFIANTAVTGGGGGLCNNNLSTSDLTNCLFASNTAVDGGAIGSRFNSGVTVTNCTFSHNVASQNAGGIYVNTGELSLTNSILWGNTSGLASGEVAQLSLSGVVAPIFSHSIVEGWSGAFSGVEVSGANPVFVDADGPDNNVETHADNNYRLGGGSPAINAGLTSVLPASITTDLDGNPRIVHKFIDMGAYERQSTSSFDGPIPAVSEWGLAVTTLLLLTMGTAVLQRRTSLAFVTTKGSGGTVR